jgi:SAM-dependent methyltransferase
MSTLTRSIRIQLPAEFDCDDYRLYNPDLSGLSDRALAEHYAAFGAVEGRRANSIASRADFAALIPHNAEALEIGPFHNPLLRGRRTKYFDVLSREVLIERAASLDIHDSDVPDINFVSSTGDLTIVDKDFDFILSSHCLEHQPDLVTHLQNVERLLRPGGRYFLLVPDQRYCFDHFIAESTLAGVLAAYEERRTLHTLESVLEHRVLTTHNESHRHWAHDHGVYLEDYVARTRAALEEYRSAAGSYIDVHAWYFTPANARVVLSALRALELTQLEIERLYPTRMGANEFWLVLRK